MAKTMRHEWLNAHFINTLRVREEEGDRITDIDYPTFDQKGIKKTNG